MIRIPPGRMLETGHEAEAVGCEILGYCRECQFDTYHEVLEAYDSQVRQVVCRRCGCEEHYGVPREIDEQQWFHMTRWDRRLDVFERLAVYGAAALMFVMALFWALSAGEDVEREGIIEAVKVSYTGGEHQRGYAVYLQISVRTDDGGLELMNGWHMAPDTRPHPEEAQAKLISKRFGEGDSMPVYCTPDTEKMFCSPTTQGPLGDYITAVAFLIIGILVIKLGSVHLKKKKKKAN